MDKILIVVDMQKDFVDGALGTPEAVAIVPAVVQKISQFSGKIYATLDTHPENYMETSEGKKLPVPHCIKGTSGWELDKDVASALAGRDHTIVEKPTFGSLQLPELIMSDIKGEPEAIELLGLCTDICVVSNALILKAAFPDAEISVDASLCAGVTPESHNAALEVMKMCQINVVGR